MFLLTLADYFSAFPVVVDNSSSYSDSCYAAVVDTDGDGIVDVVREAYGSTNGTLFSLIKGNYPGQWNSPATIDELALNGKVAVADVDNDGLPELILTGSFPDYTYGYSPFPIMVNIYHRDSNGSEYVLSSQINTTISAFYPCDYEFGIADMNSDDYPDIVLVGGSDLASKNLTVFFNDGSGCFTAIPPYFNSTAGAMKVLGFAVGDVNDDGKSEIVVSSNDTVQTSLKIFYWNGSFIENANLSVMSDFLGPLSLADMDGDGDLDVVYFAENYTFEGNYGLFILKNTSGNFSPQIVQTFSSLPAHTYLALDVADIDADSDLDVVISYFDSSLYQVIVKVFTNDGAGSLSCVQDLNITGLSLTCGYDIFLTDGDGNGSPDIFLPVSTTAGSFVYFFQNISQKSTISVDVSADYENALTWNYVEGADGYHVFKATSEAPEVFYRHFFDASVEGAIDSVLYEKGCVRVASVNDNSYLPGESGNYFVAAYRSGGDCYFSRQMGNRFYPSQAGGAVSIIGPCSEPFEFNLKSYEEELPPEIRSVIMIPPEVLEKTGGAIVPGREGMDSVDFVVKTGGRKMVVVIYTILGEEVARVEKEISSKDSSLKWKAPSNLPAGTYIAVISVDGKVVARKKFAVVK